MSEAPEPIEAALELEQLDNDIFRSIRLWKPLTGRGAFGGQIIAQSARAAGATVNPELLLHSLHCYFLSFGDVDFPVLYMIDRSRDGRSYATRSVKAVQKGKEIFVLNASFQRPEPEQPRFQIDISQHEVFRNIALPENCLSIEESMQNLVSADPNMSEKVRQYFLNTAEERRVSSIEIRSAYPADPFEWRRSASSSSSENVARSPCPQQAIWFRTRAKMPLDDLFHKCVIAYASDFQFIGTAARALGLRSSREPRLAMMASLDHSLHFYHPADASQWLLFVMEAQAAGDGRGLVHGRIYTQDGKLAVVVQQEGVVRAQVKKSSKL
ncbi:Thioesterase/thiol ester dehydrase-isomerase [Cystobasidium minutum MCA 4210]|uniref:Thioesterase/thiol ester dehydrase-isomerase n=1 Tax=Cystobasidium minutum MCA 4210 TaxID=1397322 RepID=UPI0034CF0041|eukprot:jgi/Rhomi1/104424/CE104423_1101